MSVDLFGIHRPTKEKKAGTKTTVPALSWLVARINSCRGNSRLHPADSPFDSAQGRLGEAVPTCAFLTYAVLLGRTVKSRTWVRMLDICIPFNCETNGRISAMN